MQQNPELIELLDFLACPTPTMWLEQALAHPDLLLIDHAHCEKKAASTALNMMFRYVEYPDLLDKMSRLAREELRHFEQVLAIMRKRGVTYRHLDASRYAQGLRRHARTDDPRRLIDLLIIGAFIEARSCERFAALAEVVDAELGQFYRSLLKSEARHYRDYLTLAQRYSAEPIHERVALFRDREAELICLPDREFQFHSGPVMV